MSDQDGVGVAPADHHSLARAVPATLVLQGTAAVAIGSLRVIAGAGSVAGLSGPGIMSGLAVTGPGGTAGGLATLGVLPGLIGVGAVHHALRDEETCSDDERKARAAGRAGSIGGAAVGSVGGIAAVSTAGGVAGLSAAGITSGLAAVGSAVGGGMAAGVLITILAPAVCAAVGGVGLYEAWSRLRRISEGDQTS